MAEESGHGDQRSHFVIHVDGVKFEVAQSSMTGAQIKLLAGKAPEYQLFLEEKGNQADRMLSDAEGVEIKNGLHFYTVPPATFGERWDS